MFRVLGFSRVFQHQEALQDGAQALPHRQAAEVVAHAVLLKGAGRLASEPNAQKCSRARFSRGLLELPCMHAVACQVLRMQGNARQRTRQQEQQRRAKAVQICRQMQVATFTWCETCCHTFMSSSNFAKAVLLETEVPA